MSENHAARPHPEHVLLELGGDLGALIVYTDPVLHGAEIEISGSKDDGSRSHKDVLERSIDGHPTYAAVFDLLTQGSYTLWVEDNPCARSIEVEAGRVVELDWRTTTAPHRTVRS
jgi:hypothetical protein